jgi:hypothetical protein
MSGHSYSLARDDHGWSKKHKSNPGSRITAKRSTQALAIALLIVVLLWLASRSHRTRQASVVTSTNPGQAEKYAIVTFETRPVTYWKESLGNKFIYARRHGYISLNR